MKYKYFSYIRKSTSGQKYERQLEQLTDFAKKDGILPHDYNLDDDLLLDTDKNDAKLKADNKLQKYITIVTESRTGTDQNRPALLKLVETLKYERSKGDVCLLLVECTRLGRSYAGNMKLFQDLKDNDIKFVVVTCKLLDSRVKDDNPATALISDIVLAVFNWQAQQEIITKEERCSAGRIQAKKRGVKFGRKNMTKADLPKEFIKVIEEENKRIAEKQQGRKIIDLIDSINGKLDRAGKKPISRATFYNYRELYKQND